MVTTFNPPAKPKKKKQPVLAIALGVIAGVLAAALIYVFTQLSAQTNLSSLLKDAVTKVSTAAGSEEIAAEVWADQAELPLALDALASNVAERTAGLQAANAQLDERRVAIERITGERDAAMQQLADIRGQADGARRELAEQKTAFDALKKKYDTDVQVLNDRIAELTPAPVEEGMVAETALDEVSESVAEEVSEEVAVAPVKHAAFVVPDGKSQLFKTVRYDGAKQQLSLVSLNDQHLVYKNVPEAIFDGLVEAPVFDIYYRFKVMDNFESTPNDRELIQSIRR